MDSKLTLTCDYQYGRTNIKDIFYTPPYKIMHPFMDGPRMELILMSSSAGLLAGDFFDCNISIGKGASLVYTTQSYEKILDTKDAMAKRKTKIKVADQGSLKYLPQPSIPFANSCFEAENNIFIKQGATLAYSDIFSCGRVAMGEKFKMNCFRSRTRVFVEDKPVLYDNTLLCPKIMEYSGLGLWGDYTHSGMLYVYLPEKENEEIFFDGAREVINESGIFAGISRVSKGILIRSLGYSGDELFKLNKKISDII